MNAVWARVVLLLISLVVSAGFTRAEDAPLRQVRVAQFGQAKFLLYLPLYLAMEEGYFKDEGIDVSLVFSGNDDQIFSAVASGSVEFGVGDPIFTAIAAESGFKAKTVAMLIDKLALFGYTNRKDLGVVTDVQQLAGLRVGTFPSPSTTYTLLSKLNAALAADKKMALVEGAHGAQLALLTARQVDIAIDLKPAAALAEEQGNRVVFDLTRFTESAAITGLMATQKTIDGDPRLVRGMVRAIGRSLRVLNTDPESALRVARRLFPDVKPETMGRAVSRVLESRCYPGSPAVPAAAWNVSLRTRIERGDLKAMQPLELAVDNSFAAELSLSAEPAR